MTTTRDGACPICGASMVSAAATLELRVNGEDVAVANAKHMRCPECGEVVFRRDQAKVFREAAFDRYRQANRLLTGKDIRALRRRHSLTPAQLAGLLRLGANTLSRWESGRNVQSSAMDILMRMLDDVPGTLDYLRRQTA